MEPFIKSETFFLVETYCGNKCKITKKVGTLSFPYATASFCIPDSASSSGKFRAVSFESQIHLYQDEHLAIILSNFLGCYDNGLSLVDNVDVRVAIHCEDELKYIRHDELVEIFNELDCNNGDTFRLVMDRLVPGHENVTPSFVKYVVCVARSGFCLCSKLATVYYLFNYNGLVVPVCNICYKKNGLKCQEVELERAEIKRKLEDLKVRDMEEFIKKLQQKDTVDTERIERLKRNLERLRK